MEETATETAVDILTVLGFAGIGLVAGLAISVLVTLITALVARRNPSLTYITRKARLPQRILFAAAGIGTGALIATDGAGEGVAAWRDLFQHGFVIVLIVLSANLAAAILSGTEEMVTARHRDHELSPHARRIRTQMQVMRRVGVAVIWVCAIAGVLLTFDAFRAVGTALFTSAGVVSIIAGLAAQSLLGNLFAGVQLAFSDALRVGDVVVVDGEQGNIEEVTLTYVVLRVWDDRRLILPSTHFTTNSFENWTRRETDLLGTVELDLDFVVPVNALRVQLQRIVEESSLWDGRTVNMQITDATDRKVTVRSVISAASPGDLWDLRCHIREELLDWLQANAPHAFPRIRLEPDTSTAPPLDERIQEEDDAVEELRRREDAEIAAARPGRKPAVTQPAPKKPHRKRSGVKPAKAPAVKVSRPANREPVGPSSSETRVMSKDELDKLVDSPVAAPSADQESPADRVPLDDRTVSHDPQDAGPQTAQARLFSGSPDADARGERLAGPSAEEMAAREEQARKRLTPDEADE